MTVFVSVLGTSRAWLPDGTRKSKAVVAVEKGNIRPFASPCATGLPPTRTHLVLHFRGVRTTAVVCCCNRSPMMMTMMMR